MSDWGPKCIADIVLDRAVETAGAAAILALDGRVVTYGALHRRAFATVQHLRRLGIGRGDRVAVALPTGVDLAVCLLTVTCGAVAAPLNPNSTADETERYLGRIAPRALLTDTSFETPALNVARTRGLAVIALAALSGEPAEEHSVVPLELTGLAQLTSPDDVAAVFLTSGTTDRPKVVALTHRNLCASAYGIARGVELSPEDRCLGLLPLHYTNSIYSLLSTVMTGGSIICPDGFQAPRFFDWLERFRPTWYTATPAIHQSILDRAKQRPAASQGLRFVRTASQALSPEQMARLEQLFDAPVVQAYGMTEGAGMVANPLPPKVRKPGSIGLPLIPAIAQIAVMDEAGRLLPAGVQGEVVIRGENVFAGYFDDPEANERCFVDGWFRTGDLGYVDEDGYFFLSGRMKELINRGGEKISPWEVDEALLAHPSVARAVTFGVAEPRLGEEVAAAVVLRDGASATPLELRKFVAERLSPHKVPRLVEIVDRLPVGPSGKVARIGLAERLGVSIDPAPERDHRPLVPARDDVERTLVGLWRDLLQVDDVGINDDFFDVGGDSLLAARLFSAIRGAFGKALPLAALLDGATIERLARLIANADDADEWSPFVTIQAAGSLPPLFCIHPIGGHVLAFRRLAMCLGPSQPVFGLQAVGLDGAAPPLTSIEDQADRYLAEIRRRVPTGPRYLIGYSSGGSIAYEMAQRLVRAGERVALLVMIDHAAPNTQAALRPRTVANFFRNLPGWLADSARRDRAELAAIVGRRLRIVHHRAQRQLGRGEDDPLETDLRDFFLDVSGWPTSWRSVAAAQYRAIRSYVPRPYSGRIVLFRARRQPFWGLHDPALRWGALALGGVEVHETPGHHLNLLEPPNVEVLARSLETVLARARVGDEFAVGNEPLPHGSRAELTR